MIEKQGMIYSSPGDNHHPLIWSETLNRSRQSNPHFAYLHAKQSNVCFCPRVFLGHQNSFVFLEWFENQLMPALKNLSLVVLDNASYHNVKTEDTVCPNCSLKKVVGHQTHHSEATYNLCSDFG
jgi:hypothetical protein